MSDRPRLLDLFCGAGGCACGYVRAGFEVHGVDNRPQKNYLKSGASSFTQADALEYCREHGHEFDAIHASPPCQRYSVATRFHRGVSDTHPDLVAPTRAALIASGLPYVIENVMGAPLRNAIVLCGEAFGLKVYRHRLFELSFFVWQPSHVAHPERPAEVGRAVPEHGYMTVAGHFSDVKAASRAMGIDWMTRAELSQAIPPTYTEFIGKQLIEVVRARTGTRRELERGAPSIRGHRTGRNAERSA